LSNNSLVYASFSVGNKEPNRSDFVDSPDNQTPKPETLRDIEAGFKKKSETMWLNANFYYMDYKNQLVLTGQLNDVGSPLRTNVDKSYRAGIELEGRYDINPTISVSANATFSKNIIQSYNEVLYDYGVSWDEYNEVATTFNNTSIAFSPSLVAGGSLIVHPVDGLEIAWVHKYVGKQYLDNTSNESRKLDAYYVSDARASYGFSALGMERISFNIAVYNLFNNLYESNGYTWGYIVGGTEYHENFYYPQAGAHFMAGLTIKL
ncbi:MAG: TonB-dependent receptor, partial [Cyclobacteriaceae bacterium]|nr:TonB-dependent receptor [Cyclobacteriaceae bacterium]